MAKRRKAPYIHWSQTEKGKKRLEEIKASRNIVDVSVQDASIKVLGYQPIPIPTTLDDAIQLLQHRIANDEKLLADLKTLYTQLQGK